MDAGRLSIRSLGSACAVLVLAALTCLWLARTNWPGSEVLRMEAAPHLRVADGVCVLAVALVAGLLGVLFRQASGIEQSLARTRRVLEVISEGIAVVDDQRRIVFASGPMGRLFDYAPEELLSHSVDLVLAGGLPEPGKGCVGRRKDGSVIHLEWAMNSSAAGIKPALTTLVLRDVTPSKQARETLHTRETYLRMVVEQMPAILWTTDKRLQITSTVGAGLAALNLDAKDVIGMSMLECLERDQLECTPISAHMKALHGQSLSYEMEWKGRTFQVRVDPLRNSEKTIAGTIGILVDITDHKQAMAELKARVRQQAAVAKLGQRALEGVSLEALLSESVTLISQTLDVEFCAVLEASLDQHAFVPRATVGWGTEGRVPAKLGVEKQAARTLRSTEPIIVTDRNESLADSRFVSGISTIIPGERRPFGVLTAHTTRAHTFTRDDSHFIQAVAHILAASFERKRAEEARARLVAILEATTDVVAMTGTNRRLLYLNGAGRTLLGLSLSEDVSTFSLSDFCAPSLRQRLDESIAAAVCDGAWCGEMTLVNRAGVEIGVSQVILAHKSPSGVFEFLSTIARDTTERQNLEGQLRQAQKMEAIGRLAGGIAHDFNNLLCIITGYAALLADGLSADEPLRPFAGEITKAADRATALTQQLLAFSRKQMLVPHVLDLNTLLTDLDKMLRRLIGEDIELVLAPGADLYPVKADHSQMEQVLMNLVVNSRDAMPRGGKLTIATANVELDEAALRHSPEVSPGSYVRLEVSDTGCGMDKEVMAHLFEPFFTTKGQGKGTGLGLATVFGIVQQSGGHIRVVSQPGLGATFHIYLPRFQADAPAEPRDASVELTPPGGAETLLVVEDEDSLRALASLTLRQRGYHVLEASNGEEALEVSRGYAQVIHLLLSDVVMPKLGGNALAERLIVERPDIKVLFMSGFTDSALFRHGVVTGEVECLLKPFTPAALAEKVREILDRPAPILAAP